MPFQEQTKMQARQNLVSLVLNEGISVAAAARQHGVSRTTAHHWINRARQDGIDGMSEHSRHPCVIPRATPSEIERAVLSQKQARPAWGAKKISAILWPQIQEEGQDKPPEAPVCLRTVDRILKRNGLVQAREKLSKGDQRFEREHCNDLWQLDYKGLPFRYGYFPLSVLDDHSRYLLLLSAQSRKTIGAAFESLWNLFGEVGMPDSILTDNGDGFNDWQAKGPTRFEAQLWLLGIRVLHGRARHPQTQGKVERFHGTLKREMGENLAQADVTTAQRVYAEYRECYNWERPHEALQMRVPGRVYEKSSRLRPDRMPCHEIAEGSQSRKVGKNGIIEFNGRRCRAGKGLYGEYVEIREEEDDYAMYYANVRISSLTDGKV